MKEIYLDNAATTFPKPKEVVEAVSNCVTYFSVNPNRGINSLVKTANSLISDTRYLLAQILGTASDQIVFTPSATYSINIVIHGFNFQKGDYIYISPFEHNSVYRSLISYKDFINIKLLPISTTGFLDVEETTRWFESCPPKLVVITHACNVTGDILPIKDVIEIAHRYEGKVLVDAAQTMGVYTPTLTEYNYDYLAFSSHKGIYGIPGAGCLILNDKQNKLRPLIYGGTGINSEKITMPEEIPERFEVGTQPLPSIVSILAGIQWIEKTGKNKIIEHVNKLKMILIDGLNSLGINVISNKSDNGNIGTVAFTIPNIDSQEINTILNENGICVRSGLHCAPLAHKTYGSFPNGAVRISPGFFNTDQDILRLLALIEKICL